MILKKISKNNKCKRCDAGTRVGISFPSGITRDFIELCKKNGFVDNPKHTKAGLLYIQKGLITISGSLCLKNATLFCPKKQCEKEIDEVLMLLDSLFP